MPIVKPRNVSPQTFAEKKYNNHNIFVLQPHPYTKYPRNEDTESVVLFHRYLVRRFGDEIIHRYEICEALDIHRCVWQEWEIALIRSKYIKIRDKGRVHISYANPFKGVTNLTPAQKYNPWNDRNHDEFMNDYYSVFPWFVIDKYYLITVDEVKLLTGQQRIRPDGRKFKPIRYSIHPSENHEAFNYFREARRRGDWEISRYHDLCEAATGEDQKILGEYRGSSLREITAYNNRQKEKLEQEARDRCQALQARIERLGIAGHAWLENFIKQAPNTPDEWFRRALQEDQQRIQSKERWKQICKKLGLESGLGDTRKIPKVIKRRPRASKGTN